MTEPEIEAKSGGVKVSKKAAFVIGGLLMLFVIFLVLQFILLKNSQQAKNHPQALNPVKTATSPTARRWQLVFSYSRGQQSVELKKMSIEKGEASPAVTQNTDYILSVYDKQAKLLYQTSVPLSRQVIYNIYFPPNTSSSASLPKQPNTYDTVLTVPYLYAAENMKLTHNNSVILEFSPLKDDSLSFVPKAYAEESKACQALSLVFLSEGYQDMAKFKSDAEQVKSALFGTLPFSNYQAVVDTKLIESSVKLGCIVNNQLEPSCVTDSQAVANILKAGNSQHAYAKYIVLVDAGPKLLAGGAKVLGAASGVGGDIVVMQTKEFAAVSAVHEIGGHAIGQLYDRYVDDQDYNQPAFTSSFAQGPKSNCTDKASGEASWGGSGAGCTLSTLYAPIKPSCAGNGGVLLSGGSPETVMSAASCFAGDKPVFDKVETAWITNIMKNYEPLADCLKRSVAAPSPSPAAGASASAAFSSLPPMATKIADCPARPPAGSPGTVEPDSFRSSRDSGNNDPDLFFGHYKDSLNKADLYYTTGQANNEARWAGSNHRNPANGEYRGMFYVRAGKPQGIERAGGYVYNPAWDYSSPYGRGHYTESGWSRVMGFTGDAEKGATDKDRNCILATSVQRLIRDDQNSGKDKEYYTSSKMWYRVPLRPAPPASEANSVLKIHATGAGFSGGNFPTLGLYIDQYLVKTWKNLGQKPTPGDIYTYPDPTDPADASVRIGKVKPHQVIVGILDSKYNDDDGKGKVNGITLYSVNIDGKDYSSVDPSVLKANTYDQKLESCVTVPGKEFESPTGGWFWCGYFWFDYANALKDPYNSPTIFKNISANGALGTGSSPVGSTPVEEAAKEKLYSCQPDPNCKVSSGAQICALKCNPR